MVEKLSKKSDQDNFEEDNPYGYIRYISDIDSEDEITILLPSPRTSNASSIKELKLHIFS